MADEKEITSANRVYATLCNILKSKNLEFDNDEELLTASFEIQGKNNLIMFIMIVDAERQLIRVYSPLAVKFSQENRVEGAAAICYASYGLYNGSFDYDLFDGSIVFRMVTSFKGSLIGDKLIESMISCTCMVVDEYSDKFSALESGTISIDEFLDIR